MEFISASQLQQYENVLDEINEQFLKYENLKRDVEKETDKILVSRLADNNLSEKVSNLSVKIFSDIFELYNLYSGELINTRNLLRCGNCKLCLIEIYISKPLMQKVSELNCLIHICAKTENTNINRTLKLTNNIPVMEVIPLDENSIMCDIEASLVLPTDYKWIVIKLDSVYVNISYHFEMIKEKRKTKSQKMNILHITKSYNNESLIIKKTSKPILLENKLQCDVEKFRFIEAIIGNSYHRLNIELFSQWEGVDEFLVQLSSGLDNHKLLLNKQEKTLLIKSNVKDLLFLKKHFFTELYNAKLMNPDALREISKVGTSLCRSDKKISDIILQATSGFPE